MRLFLSLSVCVLLASCQGDKPDYRKLIQGNWECQYVNKEDNTLNLNLYFSDSICHLFRDQDNVNTFHIKNDSIEIETIDHFAIDYGLRKHVLKIVQVTKDLLRLIVLSKQLNDRLKIVPTDTIEFKRMKKKNNLQIRRISFYSTGCNGACPSFTLEMTPDDPIVYDGYSYSDFEGTYWGKSSPIFWKFLKDKAHYIDFKNWKEKYKAPWTCDQTCALIFETNKSIYKVSIYGNDKEPKALRNIIDYIISNYASLNLKKVNRSAIQFKHKKYIQSLGFQFPQEILLN